MKTKKIFRNLFLSGIVGITMNATAQWQLPGNAGTNPPTDFVGTTDANDLVFKTNNTEGFRLSTNSYLGIGTTSPNYLLDVNGYLNINSGYAFKVNGTDFLKLKGTDNVLLGPSAGASISSATYNTFVGYQSGYVTTTGGYNTFSGYKSGYANTSGASNTFMGWHAGYSNTTGGSNLFLGQEAGAATTTGGSNTFVGTASGLYNTTASNNTCVGFSSGLNITTGTGNVCMGLQAGIDMTTGSYNNIIGYVAGGTNGGSALTGNGNSVFGYHASNALTSGYNNVAIGYNSAPSITSGYSNVVIGDASDVANGYQNLAIGYNATVNSSVNQSNAFGQSSNVQCSDCSEIGRINGDGSHFVGIGTATPGHQLELTSSDAVMPGGGPWNAPSDSRLKKDILNFDDGMNILLNINPVSFIYNGKGGISATDRYIGVIAQDVKKIAPYMIKEYTYKNPSGDKEQYLSYNANALTYILVNSVKTQQKQIDSIRFVNNFLIEQLTSINQKLDALKNSGSLMDMNQNNSKIGNIESVSPNPFYSQVSIKYNINIDFLTAQITIEDNSGNVVFNNPIKEKGANVAVFNIAGHSDSNLYICKLQIDGKVIDTVKLLNIK